MNGFEETVKHIVSSLNKFYWTPIYELLKENPEKVKNFTNFLLFPREVIIYMGRNHIGIEYIGAERAQILCERGRINIRLYDYSLSKNSLIEEIIGFAFDAETVKIPISGNTENLIFATDAGWEKLFDLNWNFAAQDGVLGFNSGGLELVEKEFCRIINGLFFNATNDRLKTRHIQWLDLIPIIYDDSNDEYDSFKYTIEPYKKLVINDFHYIYPVPHEFKYEKLLPLNRFIQLFASSDVSETDITSFLIKEENKFNPSCRSFRIHKMLPVSNLNN